MRKAYLEPLKKSKNISICINGNVTQIETNDIESMVERVHVSCLNGIQFFIQAKYFILACGGWENPRLLLLSRQNNSLGMGNKYDTVGRYYMEHPKAILGKIYPTNSILKTPLLSNYFLLPKGRARFGLRLSDQTQEREKILNHYVMFKAGFSEKLNQAYDSLRLLTYRKWTHQLTSITKLPEHLYKVGTNLGNISNLLMQLLLQKPLNIEHLIIENHLEQQPNPESRVMLSDQLDKLGLNLLKIDWKISSEEKNDLIRFHRILKQYLEHHQIGRLESPLLDPKSFDRDLILETHLTDSSHHMGTTRMSDNPRQGVVDQNCQVHGIKNLFIAGSSVFPTSGHGNPTLTIVALAIRLADHLKTIIKRE